MSNPRLRRLKLDYDRLIARFRDWRAVKITGVAGTPPEHYQVTFYVKGLYASPEGKIMERHEHVAELNLSLGYPRRAPQCKMLTPVFHPNFDESSICIGDFWAASEGLDDLVVRIGRMITYQEYNTKSPLNGLAAKWAAEHSQLLPVDSSELAPPSSISDVEQQAKIVLNLNSATQRSTVVQSVDRVFAPRLAFGTVCLALRDKTITIGRDEDNTIQLNEQSVSGHHASIVRSTEALLVRDLGSTNGTKVNGSRVAEATLKDGDRVEFGDVAAIFVV